MYRTRHETEYLILKAVRENPGATKTDIMYKYGTNTNHFKLHFEPMVLRDYVRVDGRHVHITPTGLVRLKKLEKAMLLLNDNFNNKEEAKTGGGP